jgi:hypothetical protein
VYCAHRDRVAGRDPRAGRGFQGARHARSGGGRVQRGVRLQPAHPRRLAIRRLRAPPVRRLAAQPPAPALHAVRRARRHRAVCGWRLRELYAEPGPRPAPARGQGAVGDRHLRAAHLFEQEPADRNSAHVPVSHDARLVRDRAERRQAARDRGIGPVRHQLLRICGRPRHAAGGRLVLGHGRDARGERTPDRVRARHGPRHPGLGQHDPGRERGKNGARQARARAHAVGAGRRLRRLRAIHRPVEEPEAAGGPHRCRLSPEARDGRRRVADRAPRGARRGWACSA